MEEIKAEVRSEVSKRSTKALRQNLMVPGVLYGKGREPLPLAVHEKALTLIVRVHGHSAVCTLKYQMNGNSEPTSQLAIYKELRLNPLTRRVEHVDFYAIRADEKIQLAVPIHLVGTAKGVDLHGGVLIQSENEIEIRCFPDRVPEFIELDVSDLDLHDAKYVRDLALPEGLEAAEPQKLVAACSPSKMTLAAEGVPAAGAATPEAGAPAPEAGTEKKG